MLDSWTKESNGNCSNLTKRIARCGTNGLYPQNIERDLVTALGLPLVAWLQEKKHWFSSFTSACTICSATVKIKGQNNECLRIGSFFASISYSSHCRGFRIVGRSSPHVIEDGASGSSQEVIHIIDMSPHDMFDPPKGHSTRSVPSCPAPVRNEHCVSGYCWISLICDHKRPSWRIDPLPSASRNSSTALFLLVGKFLGHPCIRHASRTET